MGFFSLDKKEKKEKKQNVSHEMSHYDFSSVDEIILSK